MCGTKLNLSDFPDFFVFAVIPPNIILMNAIQQTDYRNWCMGYNLTDKADQYDWIITMTENKAMK